MKLVTEGQIEANENLLTGCSADDAALINSDPNLNDQQRFEAMMNPEAYKFHLNNPYVIKDVQNFPALFRNLADPNDYVISRAYQAEFEEYENRLSKIARTQTPLENAWHSFRVTQEEMRKGDLNAQRMDAIKDNDEEKIKELDKKIQEKQAEIDALVHPSRQGFSGTIGSLGASIARELPEMLATGIATSALGAAAGPTGGATAPAAAVTAGRFARSLYRIKKALTAYKATKIGMGIAKGAPYLNNVINAGVIYNDTTNVARGQMYEQLSKAHPEWSEDALQDLSWSQARYQGLLEAGTSFVGVTARGGKAIYNIAGKAALMKKGVATIEASAVSDIEKEAAKKAFSNLVESGLIKPELARNNAFLRSTINKVMELREKRLVKGIEFGADMALEGATEVYQNAIEDVVKNMTLDQVGSVNVLGAAHEDIKGYIGEMYDYMVTGKEMSPDAQEAWSTFKNVALGSAVFGAAFNGVDAASKRIFRNKAQSPGEQLDAANKTVQTFDTVLEQKGNSKVGEKSPTTLNNFYKNAIKSGEIPETLYVRLDKLKEIVTKMKDDPVAMAKLNAMNIGEKMSEAENDGGLVEFDSSEFIENVVDPKNDTLYQTIKGDISANPALGSQNDIFELIENVGKADETIKIAQEDPNSIYNKVLENQKNAGSDEKLAKVNAIIAQSMFNTFQRMRNDKATMEQIINQIGLRIENVDTIQPGMGELNQPGYVSMRGTLEGTELDWKEHRGTGEGHEVHGAGIYVLKDQATNKARYYDAWSKQVLKLDGVEYSGGEYNTVINMMDKGFGVDEIKKELEKSVGELSKEMNSIYSKIEEIRKKYPKVVPYNEVFYDFESATELAYSGIFTKSDIQNRKDELDKVDSEMTQEERLKAAEVRRLEKARGLLSKDYSELADVLDRLNSSKDISFESTGAQYEVDVPASKYLLNENKRFFGQSKYVQDRLRKLKDKLDKRELRYKYDRDKFDSAWKKFGSNNPIAEMLAWNGTVNIINDINASRERGNIIESLEGLKKSALENKTVSKALSEQYGSIEKYNDAVDEAIRFHKKNKFENLVVEDDYFARKNPTGEQIYDALVESLGSKTEASLALSEVGIKGIEYDGNMDGKGYVIFEGKDVPIKNRLYQYGGRNAATALIQQLSAAQSMEQKNVPMAQILKDTGWFRDPADNQWKFEISDKDAKLDEKMLEKIFANKKKDATLKDILQHDNLFKAYPFLADMPVYYNSHLRTTVGRYVEQRFFGTVRKYIEIAKTKDFEDLRYTLLHEIAHAIQHYEGFATGGSIKGTRTIPQELKTSYRERQLLFNSLWSDLKENGVIPDSDIDPNTEAVSYPAFMDAMPYLEKIAKNKPEIQKKLERVKELNERLKKFDERDPALRYLMIPGENEARDVEARADMSDKERAEKLPANLAGVRSPVVKFTVDGEVTEVPVQENPVAQIAGSIEFGAETIIRLSKISNPTTFSHEMAHLFGRQLFGAYNAGLLTERWAKNTDKLAEFLGIEKDEFDQYQFAGNTEAEEKLAEAFTSYLETGKAPAPYLKELFDLIKEWFSEVYKMLKMAKVPLDRKVTKVFDEIFVPYEKQKQILLERRYGFIAKPANMTQDQYERYIAAKRAAASRGQTIDTKVAAKMHEIMSNDTYRAEYEAAYQQAFEDLGNLPVYQMIDYVIQEKITRASLDKVSKDIKLPRQYVSTKEGLDITQVYSQFTDLVKSPEEMANMLAETPSRESAAEYAANEHMKEWLQENYPEVAEMDSELASRNEQVFKLAVMEYMMLSGIGMERFNQIHNDMLAIAEYMVQRMPLKKIANVQRWIEQESKLMQRYDYTLTDKQKAQIKRQQAFLNYYTMRAKQIRQETQRFIRRSKKYRGPQTKDVLKTIDGETFDLLKSMLNKFKISNSKPNTNIPMGTRIDNWVEMMSNNNYSAANEISRYKTALVNGVEDKLTTADFELLKDAFEFVEACGKKLKTIQVGEKIIMVENAAQAIADAFAQAGIKPRDKELGMAVMREAIMRELFPTQVFLDFVAPVFKGLTRKDMQIQKWRNELADILKPFGKDLQKKMTIDGRSYTIEQLLVMMLNSGNQHNINCIVKTIQSKLQDPDFNEDALFSVLEQSPKYLREATRRIWQIFEDNKQAFQEAQTKIDGKVLRFVEAQPYTFSDGEEMQGGYYPAGKVSVINDYENSQTKFDNSGTYATKSFQKDRSYAHNDLDLTLNTLGSWFYKMAGVLHVAVPYNNMGKLLKNQTFRNAVGDGMVKSLSEWLQLSVAPERVNQILSAVNQFVSVGTLGLKWVKTFTQMSGMIPSMAEVGPGYVARAAATTNPIKAIENASKLSEYMFARYAHPEDHLQLYMRTNNLFGESISKLNNIQFEKVMNFAMIFTIYGDAIASTVTWKAEYAKQIDAGRTHNQAVELADSAVRRLQGDSSAGSRPPILQGDKRFFTMFASYFIGIHSMLVAHKISGDKVKMAALLFAAAVAAPMFEAIFSTANDWIGADDDDKKKYKKEGIKSMMDLYLNQAIGNVASSAGAFWLPQFGVGSTLGTAVVTGKVYSPRNMQIEYMLKPIEIGTDLIQAAKLSSQGKNKKAEQKLKNGLKKIFEFGMINSSVSDRLSNLLIGE